MDTPTYLAMLRRRLNDIDQAAQRFTDTELWEATADVTLDLTIRGVALYGPYVVDTVAGGITPALSDEDGLLTITQTAWVLLSDLYRQKVSTGELGGSWKSGLEEESSTANQKAYKEALDELQDKVDRQILLKARILFASRKQ